MLLYTPLNSAPCNPLNKHSFPTGRRLRFRPESKLVTTSKDATTRIPHWINKQTEKKEKEKEIHSALQQDSLGKKKKLQVVLTSAVRRHNTDLRTRNSSLNTETQVGATSFEGFSPLGKTSADKLYL